MINFQVELQALSGYQMQCLEPHDNLVEFMWCLEDLGILKFNQYESITLEDVKEIIDLMHEFGFKSKLKEIETNENKSKF